MLHIAPRGERTGTRNASPRPPRSNARRWLASLLVALGGLTASHTSYAESHLEVVIRETTRPPDEGRILIDTTFINTGDAPFFLHMPSTLFGRTDDGLHGDRFIIKDADGKRLSYRGQGAGSWGRPRLSHFVVIPAGETVHKEVDLTTGYEFPVAGDFTVRFAAELNVASLDLESAPRAEVEAVLENSQSSVESNEIVIHVRAASPLRTTVFDPLDDTCNAAQLASINEALPIAKEKAYKAHAFIVTDAYPFSIQNGQLVYRYVPKQRFERWFGAPPIAAPLPHEAAWNASDSGEVKSALLVVHSRLIPDQTPGIVIKCGCPGSAPTVAAKAEDHNLYLVRFCPAFFSLPLVDNTVSRVGTIVHEMSHFYDGFPGRSDYVYGKSKCEALAKTDRWKAVRNADNFEFFTMDTTPYEELPKSE